MNRRHISIPIEALERRRLISGTPHLDPHLAKDYRFLSGARRTPVELLGEEVGPSLPPLSGTIEAINFNTNANTTGYYQIPPDSHAAVGPNHVVNVVNSTIQWHTKSGTTQNSQRLGKNSSTATGSFFASLNPTTGTFDPKVIYDQHAGRFVVVTLEQASNPQMSRILVAASDDSDPNGVWRFFAIDSKIKVGNKNYWADYPGLAVDEEAIYITNNMFPFGPGAGQGSRLWIIPKNPFYSGWTATFTVHDPAAASGLSFDLYTLQPAHVFGAMPGTVGTFLVASGVVSGSDDLIQIIRVNNPLSSPTFTAQSVNPGNVHNNSSFPSGAPQPGTTHDIDAGDGRLYNAIWRDNALWTSHTVNPPSGTDAGQATIHWYKIDTTNLSSPTLADHGSIGGEQIAAGTYTYYPMIMVDSAGNMGLSFSASAPTVYAGAYYTGRLATDAAGTTYAPQVLAAGTDYYIRYLGGSRNRWGDYNGISLDPADDGTFWIYNQYATARGTIIQGLPNEDGRWATRIGRFSFLAPPTGSITGTIYQDNNTNGALEAGEPVLDGVVVFIDADNDGTIDLGESTTTSAGGGGYTFIGLAAGTYTVRQVVPSGMIAASPAGGVASVLVSGGATSTQDFTNFPIVFTGSGDHDSYTLRNDPLSSLRLQVLETWGAGPTTSYSILKSIINAAGAGLSFSGGLGNDLFTVVNSGVSPIPTAGIIISGGNQSSGSGDQLVLSGGSSNDTVSLGNTAITFAGTITYSGLEGITANTTIGNDTLNYHGPVATPVIFNGGTGIDTFNLHSGTYAFAADANAGTAELTLNVNAGTVTFNSTQHLAALNIASGAAAIMTADGDRYLQTKLLSITGSGKLDLNDNDLIIDYDGPSPYTIVRQWVQDGYSDVPDAGKTGIVSTAGQNSGTTILALYDNALLGASEWPVGSGNTIASTTIVGKYTYFGDITLDGQVSGDDNTGIDANFNTTPATGIEWLSGDANLDLIVTGDDYTVTDANMGLGTGDPL